MGENYNIRMNRKSDGPICAANGFDLNGISEQDIAEYIGRVGRLPSSPGMIRRLGFCLVVDLSDSMARYFQMTKQLIKEIIEQLNLANYQVYTIDLILIHNNYVRTIYYGDHKRFDVDRLIQALPTPRGCTPYAQALAIGANHMKKLYDTMEDAKHYYNACPSYMSITDSLNNRDDGKKEVENLAKQVAAGQSVITEFITQLSEPGLFHGGYKVFIDQDTSKDQVDCFMHAFWVGSSTITIMEDGHCKLPDKRDREGRNRFWADNLLFELSTSYDRRIQPLKEKQQNS